MAKSGIKQASATKILTILMGGMGFNFLITLPGFTQNYPGRIDQSQKIYVQPLYNSNTNSNYTIYPNATSYPYAPRISTPTRGTSIYNAAPSNTPFIQRTSNPRGNVTNYTIYPNTINLPPDGISRDGFKN